MRTPDNSNCPAPAEVKHSLFGASLLFDDFSVTTCDLAALSPSITDKLMFCVMGGSCFSMIASLDSRACLNADRTDINSTAAKGQVEVTNLRFHRSKRLRGRGCGRLAADD